MTARVEIDLDLRQLDKLSDRWDDAIDWIRSNRAGAHRVALNAAQVLVGRIREHVIATAVGSRAGDLEMSFREEVKVTKDSIEIAAVSDLVYAGIQDRGGVIRPKHTKALAIPLVPMALGKWPRNWRPRKTLFRRGNALSIRKGKGKRAKIENVYALAKSVTIPPRHYLEKASKAAIPEVMEAFTRALSKQVAP